MFKFKAIFTTLYFLGVAVSAAAIDFRFVFFGASIVSLAAIVGGILVFPQISRHFALELPVQEVLSDDPPMVISGDEFRLGPWRKLLVGSVKPARILVLLAVASAAALGAYKIITGQYSSAALHNIFTLEAVVFAEWLVMFLSLTWLIECWRLRRATVCIGWIISRSLGAVRDHVTYNFVDHHGDRRGSVAPVPLLNRDRPLDNAFIVFYMPEDPDNNVAGHALRFHRVFITFVPAGHSLYSAEQVG